MFKTRLISWIILFVVIFLVLFLGGPVLLLASMIVSVLGMRELYNAMGIKRDSVTFLELAAYLSVVVYYIAAYLDFDRYGALFMIIPMILVICVYVFCFPIFKAEETMITWFGVMYVGVMFSFLMLTRNMPGGEPMVLVAAISAFGCDTFAYLTGRLIGKHKMAPLLSPNKTVEGALGGIVTSLVLSLLVGIGIGESPLKYALAGGVGALAGIVGDLAASAIKRNKGIKDYSNLIPGHGGILDRFDSMLFVAPVVYFFARLF